MMHVLDPADRETTPANNKPGEGVGSNLDLEQ